MLREISHQLESKGAKTIRGLHRKFKQFDSYDGDKRLNREEFFQGLRESGVKLEKSQMEVLKNPVG